MITIMYIKKKPVNTTNLNISFGAPGEGLQIRRKLRLMLMLMMVLMLMLTWVMMLMWLEVMMVVRIILRVVLGVEVRAGERL